MTTQVLWLLLLLVVRLAADPDAGKPKNAKSSVFRRNNYDNMDGNGAQSFYPSNYNRFRRQFSGARDESDTAQFPGFSNAAAGFDALSLLRTSGPSPLSGRKGGSRNLPNRAVPFPGMGGPGALLTPETTQNSIEDEPSISFRGSGGFPGFSSSRDSRGFGGSSFSSPSKGGSSRGRNNSPAEGSSASFSFPGSSGANPFSAISGSQPFSQSSSSRGSYKTGTSSFNDPQSFGNAISSVNNPFPSPGGYGSNSGFPPSVGSGPTFGGSLPSSNNLRFPSPGSRNSFSSSNDPFSSPGRFSPSAGNDPYSSTGNVNLFPLPGGGNRLNFPGSGSSVNFPGATYSAGGGFQPGPNSPLSVGNVLPLNSNLLAALKANPGLSNLGINLDELLGIEPTTTKPPNRIISSDEDRDRIFSGGLDPNESSAAGGGGRKGGSYWGRGPILGVQQPQRVPTTRAITFTGGCGQEPQAPLNGVLHCSSYAGCRARCEPGYRFPTGESRLLIACENGQWKVRGGPWTSLPNCEPECVPACQNEGICLEPNVCSCPENWEGSLCQQPKVSAASTQLLDCLDKPPIPMNSRIFCSREECIAKCHEKYQFSAGVVRMFFDCMAGDWRIRDERWTTVPDCIATCEPGCLNGGRCLAPDICECTPEFRGDHCQYPISNCDAKKLAFNGGYNCTGEGMQFGCKLWCPAGVDFKFPAADLYNCDYATSRWSPMPIPDCDYEAAFGSFETGSIGFAGGTGLGVVVEAEVSGSSSVDTRPLTRHPGTCFTWSGMHYKSFDGRVYSFDSNCPYTLIQDAALGTFSLNLIPEKNCPLGSRCPRTLKLFLEGDEYSLSTAENGQPALVYRDTTLAIPGQMNGLITERIAHFVILKLAGLGLTVKWDLQDLVITEVTEVLWNRTAGLCGLLDGVESNDWAYADGSSDTQITNFLKAWEATNLGETCATPPVTRSPCAGSPLSRKAADFCSKLSTDPRFNECRKVVDVGPFVEACKWDFCSCEDNPPDCACSSFSSFFRECASKGAGVVDGWRTPALCPLDCGYEKEYKSCMPAIEPRCGQAAEETEPEFCVEGCDCPTGTVHMDGKCVDPVDCPCTFHNKTYSRGDTIPNDCNSCSCVAGEWQCTEVKCGSRCASVGDPHYTTFDGKKFDFMGKCSYYLVKGPDYSIEAENTPCAGAISEAMNFPASVVSSFPSCTKSVTITTAGTVIKLKQDREVIINGIEQLLLPVWINEIYVKKASNLFVIVELPNGLDVWWDGQNRAYVDAPPEMRGRVSGLCGTFTDNQKDDFLTPEGDVEQNHIAFANKWKTSERCTDMPLLAETHPCDRHVQNKDAAEKYCTKIKSNLFADCHLTVDPESYYRDCMYDLCSCEAELGACLCPIVAAYSAECARKGVLVDWRSHIRECGVHCQGGQDYQVCGDSCSHSCYDLATNPGCKRRCVEGCNCPQGFTLDAEGTCISVSQCPCVYLGKEYKPNYEMMQPDADGDNNACECVMAQWQCRVPTQNELESLRFFELPQVGCLEDRHETYTDCMPDEEPTCMTMHYRTAEVVSDTCKAGCRCEEGYVRDTDSGDCVPGHECPCHHGGRSYDEQQTILDQCNTCTCTGGEWQCTSDVCPGMCTAWGDSHYKTFDGKIFEFHGTCDYMLAKARSKGPDSFQVSVQNVPCGTNGVTCAKSLTLRVGSMDNQEVVHFSKDKPTPPNSLSRTLIREAGVFVFAEVPDMGLILQWDKGTRAYLTLDSRWKGKVKGLCGNYNDDDQDDYQTPSGGTAEASARIFGDSWRLQNYCPESKLIEDTCALHPQRKVWATEKCAVLKSSVFAQCHSEVPVDQYVSRCLFDSCGCDTGGDCECLCTALATYAHECNIHGVYISWRTQELCPMQCDESCEHYEPCIPTCPTLTCDTLLEAESPTCLEATCVEGCAKDVCPPGEVHKSATDKECIPMPDCDKKCMEIDGKVFMEGDIITEDDCHTCYCTRKKEVCRGSPCSTIPAYTSTPRERVTTPLLPEIFTTSPPPTTTCKSGWTVWINRDHPIAYKKTSDEETLPERIVMSRPDKGYCSRDMFSDIRCRVVGSHESWDTGNQAAVTCSPTEGLTCRTRRGKGSRPQDGCPDYEISVLCDCGKTVAATTPLETPVTAPPVVHPITTPDTLDLPEVCEEKWTPWLNAHAPTDYGEFETVEGLRVLHSFCPRHYIKQVECRNVDGTQLYDFVKCDITGATCRNNAHSGSQLLKYCFDAEVRVLCQCKCQDGLGMQDGSIPDSAISSSDGVDSGLLDTAPRARLGATDNTLMNNERFPVGAWLIPIRLHEPLSSQWLQIDLGKRKEVTGVVTQGSPFQPLWVEEFAVQVSSDGSSWQEIRDEGTHFAKRFSGNSDGGSELTNLLPSPVMVRFVRIIPLVLPSAGGALRIELTGCDHPEEATIGPPHAVTEPPLLHVTLPKEAVCVDGWTQWMNTHTPRPGDWDDIENYNVLRVKYSFCEESMIVGTECQVAVMATPSDKSGQASIVCSHNLGLQCVDELQSPQHCYDYEIRFLCDCGKTTVTEVAPSTVTTWSPLRSTTPSDVEMIGEECEVSSLPQPHKQSCTNFYECQPVFGSIGFLVEKTCAPGTMFNPATFTCTWPAEVIRVRPECQYLDLLPTPGIVVSSTLSPEEYSEATEAAATTVRCEDTWSQWFNVSHPHSDRGDFETYDAIKQRFPDLCDSNMILEAQCQFNQITVTQEQIQGGSPGRGRKGGRKGGRQATVIDRYTTALLDYTDSDDTNVACDVDGLVCDNFEQLYGQQCHDYAVRFLCGCDPAAVTTPALPPYTDVRFSSATPEEHMYNDWCPPGRSMKPEAIPCARLCLYYGRILAQVGHCTNANDYAPACADEETGIVCPPGMFLRDKTSCVSVFDCNCYLSNGLPAPPGKTFLVSDCEVCMCVNNQLQCDTSACVTTPALGLTTLPPSKHNFVCDEWGPWLDEHRPGVSGESESLLELRAIHPQLCADPVSVECRTVPGNQTPREAGQSVVCSTTAGLQCRNKRNYEGCLDYKVRFFCLCDVPLTTFPGLPGYTTEPKQLDLETTTLLPTLPNCYQPFWTEWFNISHPSTADGDYELIDDIANLGAEICPKAYIDDIECVYNKQIITERIGGSKGGRGARGGARKGRPMRITSIRYEETDYMDSGDVYVVCSRDVGLTCSNTLQQGGSGRCKDYAIRVYCSCDPLPQPSPGVSTSTPVMLTTLSTPYPDWPLGPECPGGSAAMDCAVPCDRVCMFYKTLLNRVQRCQMDSECAPACGDPLQGSTCLPSQFLQDNSTCVAAEDCTCRLPNGHPLPAGSEHQVSECELCRCANNQLLCSTQPGCVTTSTATVEPAMKVSTASTVEGQQPLGSTTQEPPVPTTQPIYTLPPVPPMQIRCNEWTPWLNMKRSSQGDFQRIAELRERDQFSELCETPMNISCRDANAKLPAAQLGQVLTCDTSVGLVCRNQDNSQDCYDYEVAFFCACEEGALTPHPLPVPATPVPGVVTTLAPCDAWSPWLNEQKPWLGNGDTERKTLQQLREEFGFCTQGELADIECENTAHGVSVPDTGTLCDLRFGFQCKNDQQQKGACYDYRIRYYCSCEASPATTTVVIVPITPVPSYECLPDDFVYLLGSVPDHALSASSSLNLYFGPPQVRLHQPNTRGWSPRGTGREEFLQVELSPPQTLYGFMVAGSPISYDAVEIFTVQLSHDGNVWSIVTEDPEDPQSATMYFRGPPTGTNLPVTRLLPQPREAKWIRILPVTWNNRPVMRLELLGCHLPYTTVRPAIKEICDEPMGVENSALHDDQITVSSVMGEQPFYGKSNSRLNFQPQRNLAAGAWVPENKPDQYIRFDFLEPSKVSGVVTQGRADEDQWVETFQIRYSPDGRNWNILTDAETDEDKIFYGNSDRSTAVESLFGKVIETRFLELRLLTWHLVPALRVEVIGCFHLYTRSPLETTTVTTPVYPTPPPPVYCRACEQMPPLFYSRCRPCRANFYFDGSDCVLHAKCPCYKNGVKYQVGAVFETTDCRECTCEMGGQESCQKITCPSCTRENEHSVLTGNCDCMCKPCADNTRLCPSSNYCINETQWCDGIENCLDDEKDCPVTTTPVPIVPGCPTPSCPVDWTVILKKEGDATRCPVYDCDPPELAIPSCPHPACPLGYDIHLRKQKQKGLCPTYDCELPSSTMEPYTCPPPSCPAGYEVITDEIDYSSYYYDQQQTSDDGCPHYRCVTGAPPTAPCPMPQCQEGYEINFADTRELLKPCPAFECMAITTTTMCPPVVCTDGLRTMFLKNEPGTCPQYTCIRLTTPTLVTTPMPTVSPCADVALPVCEHGQEFYQKNPNEPCPDFGCKQIGGPPPTTAAPQVLQPECEMDGRSIRTFDGTDFKLETCNHILARDKRNDHWLVSVHRNCSLDGACSRYLQVRQDQHQMTLGPQLGIEWDGTPYSVSQMQKIGSQSATFTVSRQGDSLYVQSMIYTYYVVWDTSMDVKIGVEESQLYEVDGLCGFYTGLASDDKTKPDGSTAINTEEFGKSWMLGQDTCEVATCTPQTTATAFQLCNIIDSKPFSLCHDEVGPGSFLPGCVETVCDCLTAGGTEDNCKCSALARYVTKCLEVDNTVEVQDWRVIAKCYMECPSGERYSDCHPTCEKTCATLNGECPTVQSTKCSAGCYCGPGLVRKEGHCVHPDNCGDCTCEGFGDPHYRSFDRHNFTFNGECSYVAARHRDPRGNYKFQVITHNKRCNRDPITMCTDEVKLIVDNHQADVKLLPTNNILVLLDGAPVSSFPYRNDWLAIEQPDDHHVALAVPSIHLELTYSVENYGFTITIPSHLFFNQTEGLCGNCNSDDTDDFQLETGKLASSVEEFGLSWQVVEESPGVCEIFRKEDVPCLPLPPDRDPCLKIMDQQIFGECHPLEDPVAYVSSCQQDVCLSRKPLEAACQSLGAYAKRCAQLDVCLDWRSEEFCLITCPEGLEYKVCGPGCVQTCHNYELYERSPEACPFNPSDGCYCPGNMVLQNGTCINKNQCQPCDDEGHREGDEWQTDSCTTCTCSSGTARCITKACPHEPVCDTGFNLLQIPFTGDECCGPKKKCEPKPSSECPAVHRPGEECGYGMTHQLIHSGLCSEYACVCVPPEKCPPLDTPDDASLKPGEEWELNMQGCCPRHSKVCTGSCPTLDCQEFYELKTTPATDDMCCPEQACEAPRDACIYEPKEQASRPPTKTAKGRPSRLTDAPVKVKYNIGEAWKDGPCVECECGLDTDGVPHHSCVRKSCPTVDLHPDSKDYELDAAYVDGQCCPQITRTACIDDYEVIEVGEELPDYLNGCRSVSCERDDDNRVEKVEKMFSCDESCADGWQYQPSDLYPQVCCGSCEQLDCVHDGTTRIPEEEWTSDDNCVNYRCVRDYTKGTLETRAVEQNCEEPSEEDKLKYEFSSVSIPGQCCPTFTRVSCLLNDKALKAGDSETDATDSCIIVECSLSADGGNVTRREKERACTTSCDSGSTFYDPPAGSDACCGRCIPTHCVADGLAHEVGSTWESPDDVCYQFTCQNRNDALTTLAVKRECAYFNPECPEVEIYYDPTGCCKLCNITLVAKRDCKAEPMDPKMTIGMFSMEGRAFGVCRNMEPVMLNICRGHCESGTLYRLSGRIPQLENDCYCCQPSEYEQISVTLNCNPRAFNIRRYNIKSCMCIPCNQEQALKDQPIMDETEFYSRTIEPIKT